MFKKLDKERETKLRKTPRVTKQWIRKICRVPGGKLKKTYQNQIQNRTFSTLMVELVITCMRGVLIIRLLEKAVSESTVDGDKTRKDGNKRGPPMLNSNQRKEKWTGKL